MGGRIYDASIGRFLQADPIVQSPLNSQNYNRYSYVLNNPMSYTDPSGYIFKWLGKKVKKYWRQIAAIAVAYITAGYAADWAAGWGFTNTSTFMLNGAPLVTVNTLSATGYAVAGAITGAAVGYVATGSLRGATTGAIAGMFGGVGNYGAANGWSSASRIGLSAVGGCASGKAAGGSCSTGARMAALVHAVTMGAEEIYKKVSSKYNKSGKPHLWQEGKGDVGKQYTQEELMLIETGELKVTWEYDQSKFMKSAAKWPFMDAFGEFHDGLHSAPYNFPTDQFSLIATMPPSYALTVIAAMRPHSHLYYLNLIRDGER